MSKSFLFLNLCFLVDCGFFLFPMMFCVFCCLSGAKMLLFVLFMLGPLSLDLLFALVWSGKMRKKGGKIILVSVQSLLEKSKLSYLI